MKSSTVPIVLLVAAVAGGLGWYAGHRQHDSSAPPASTGRKILYYQSAMHPWIKSDKPGQCTICGMELTPVFEGDKGIESGAGVITLGSNIIQVVHVQSQELQRGRLTRTLRVAGTVESDASRRRVVSAYVDGRLDALAVNYVGAEVQAGQPLATIYSPMLLGAEREYALLRRTLRATPDSDSGGLIEAAGQRLRRYGLTEDQVAQLATKSETNIHTDLLAPVSGTVVERFAFEGQYVKEGDRLFDVADFSVMWFQFDAYERDLGWLQPGQSVDVTLPSVPGKTFRGTIAFIDPNLKDMTRSAKVRVELPNPAVERGGRLTRELPNLAYAEGAVRIESPEVLLVPRSAVLSPGGNAVAYVDRGGSAYEQRTLRLGRLGDSAWEVLEGLEAGERIVTAGSLLIDAQAQLNTDSAAPHEHPVAAPAPTAASTAPPLSPAQIAALRAAFAYVDAVGATLSGDNLPVFQQEAARASAALGPLAAAFPDGAPLTARVKLLAMATLPAGSADLAKARQAFHPISVAAVALLREVRSADPTFAAAKIYRCPMTKKAFEGAPPQSEWLQLKAPIRNPWFGAEMLDCGTEVK